MWTADRNASYSCMGAIAWMTLNDRIASLDERLREAVSGLLN